MEIALVLHGRGCDGEGKDRENSGFGELHYGSRNQDLEMEVGKYKSEVFERYILGLSRVFWLLCGNSNLADVTYAVRMVDRERLLIPLHLNLLLFLSSLNLLLFLIVQLLVVFH